MSFGGLHALVASQVSRVERHEGLHSYNIPYTGPIRLRGPVDIIYKLQLYSDSVTYEDFFRRVRAVSIRIGGMLFAYIDANTFMFWHKYLMGEQAIDADGFVFTIMEESIPLVSLGYSNVELTIIWNREEDRILDGSICVQVLGAFVDVPERQRLTGLHEVTYMAKTYQYVNIEGGYESAKFDIDAEHMGFMVYMHIVNLAGDELQRPILDKFQLIIEGCASEIVSARTMRDGRNLTFMQHDVRPRAGSNNLYCIPFSRFVERGMRFRDLHMVTVNVSYLTGTDTVPHIIRFYSRRDNTWRFGGGMGATLLPFTAYEPHIGRVRYLGAWLPQLPSIQPLPIPLLLPPLPLQALLPLPPLQPLQPLQQPLQPLQQPLQPLQQPLPFPPLPLQQPMLPFPPLHLQQPLLPLLQPMLPFQPLAFQHLPNNLPSPPMPPPPIARPLAGLVINDLPPSPPLAHAVEGRLINCIDEPLTLSGEAVCVITLERFCNGDTVDQCPTCLQYALKDAMERWLHNHDTCPHCRALLASINRYAYWEF